MWQISCSRGSIPIHSVPTTTIMMSSRRIHVEECTAIHLGSFPCLSHACSWLGCSIGQRVKTLLGTRRKRAETLMGLRFGALPTAQIPRVMN